MEVDLDNISNARDFLVWLFRSRYEFMSRGFNIEQVAEFQSLIFGKMQQKLHDSNQRAGVAILFMKYRNYLYRKHGLISNAQVTARFYLYGLFDDNK